MEGLRCVVRRAVQPVVPPPAPLSDREWSRKFTELTGKKTTLEAKLEKQRGQVEKGIEKDLVVVTEQVEEVSDQFVRGLLGLGHVKVPQAAAAYCFATAVPHRLWLLLLGVVTVVLPLEGLTWSLLLASRLIRRRSWGLLTLDATFRGADRGLSHVGLSPINTPARSVCFQPCGSPSAAAATDFGAQLHFFKDKNLHEFNNSHPCMCKVTLVLFLSLTLVPFPCSRIHFLFTPRSCCCSEGSALDRCVDK